MRNTWKYLLLAALCLGALQVRAATPLFADDFESGDTNGWGAVYRGGAGAKLDLATAQRWSGDYSGKITIDVANTTLKLEGAFVSKPKAYFRAGLYLDPSLEIPVEQWMVVMSPANTGVGLLDKIFLKKRKDGKLIFSSNSTGDGTTVVQTGEWITLEAMYAPGQGNGQSAFWVNGTLQKSKSDLTFATAANSVMAGALESSWQSTIKGSLYVDDVVVSTERVGVLEPKCVLHHPDLRGRAGAKIQAVLSGWKTDWQLTVTLAGPGATSTVWYDAKSLGKGTFHFPVQLSGLKQGTYTITAVLKNQEGAEQSRWTGSFSKNYDKEARLTLDSDNNVRLDGRLFFPVTPFGLQEHLIADWARAGYINCLFGQNWWKPNTETMRAYAQLGADNGLPTIGPLNMAPDHHRVKELVEEHVIAARTNPNIVAYTFIDEPDYNGYPTEEIVQWFHASKNLDGSRLVHLNLMGSDFVGSAANLKIGKDWTYPNLFADIYAFDMYPMWKPVFTIATLGDAADNLMKFNRGLIPFFAFVQTCNVEPHDPVSRTPTAAEVRAMAWELVVHGAKGIQWYFYGSNTPAENFAEMAKFTQQITEYTPVILSALPAPAIDSPQTKGIYAPISLTARKFSDKTYIFAVNTTGETKTFQCWVDGLRRGSRFGIAGSEQMVAYGDNYFEDTLPPHEVRIYYTKKPEAPRNLKAVPQ